MNSERKISLSNLSYGDKTCSLKVNELIQSSQAGVFFFNSTSDKRVNVFLIIVL